MKSILEDMREELNLLKDDNRRLKEDNMSGQSLISRSEKHGAEVEKLSSDRTELSAALAQQQERDIALRKKLEEKRSLQRRYVPLPLLQLNIPSSPRPPHPPPTCRSTAKHISAYCAPA
jgi:hypothetical protein